MAIGKNLHELENAIGYKFNNTEYLENAMTHSSYSNEYKNKGLLIPSNERLEFLGDAVLEMVISEHLYDNYKSFAEGKLTRMRQQLVCEKTLAEIAITISLGDYIHLGKGEEHDCRYRPKVLADAVEALIAAVYIDCRARGSGDYRSVIISLFSPAIAESTVGSADYKTMLQQFVEKDGSATLEYEVTATCGPDHKKKFTVVAKVNNNVVGEGEACSKKNAEMLAAGKALELFGFKL